MLVFTKNYIKWLKNSLSKKNTIHDCNLVQEIHGEANDVAGKTVNRKQDPLTDNQQ
jgi:hypothetical protein